MNIGKLDRRVVIQKRNYSRDSTNTRVETWSDHATVWAEHVSRRGKESPIAGADRSQDIQQFRIRHRTVNANDYRITYQGKTFDITAIAEEGRKDTLLIDCVSIQAIA